MKGQRVRIVVADDHRIMREGLCSLLRACPDFTVVGEAADGPETIEVIARSVPDVLLMDYSMPCMDGADVTRRIRQEFPSVKVVIVSCHADNSHIRQSIEAGALGYLTKFTGVEELCEIVRAAACGEAVPQSPSQSLGNGVTQRLLPRPGSAMLTVRQTQVLKLIADGQANKQIAAELSISIKTVEKHRQEVMDKLGIHNTAGLTRYAVEAGFVPIMDRAAPG